MELGGGGGGRGGRPGGWLQLTLKYVSIRVDNPEGTEKSLQLEMIMIRALLLAPVPSLHPTPTVMVAK